MTFPGPVEGWWRDGERVFAAAVDRLSDAELLEPSRLPDWSRATLLAHLARNADALVNLLTWARTGVATPMYPSTEVRNADIARSAGQPPALLRADAADAATRLADAVAGLPPAAWSAEVRTAQGRAVPAREVLWMRVREVWVHAVDLDAGVGFADLPADLCAALADDVLALHTRRDQASAATLEATDTDWRWGSDATVVRGSIAAVAAWLTRADDSGLSGDPPPVPRWL